MSNIGPINIIPDNNQVVLQDNNKTITVVDSNANANVDVTQPITSVVQILTGPQGLKGDSGGTVDSGSFATTGSNIFNGNQTFSGSLLPAGPYSSNTSSYNLGSPTAAWKDLYVSNGSVYFITGSTSASISFNENSFTFSGGTGISLPTGSSFTGSLQGTSSYALTASFALNGGSPFPFTGSANITGSLFLVGSSSFVSSPSQATNDFFLVRNTTTTLKVVDGVNITSSANIPFQILNANNNNLLQVSQSGVVILATSSVILTGTAPNGAIYFTSSSFYVGIE
jgi:hypothetical protein